MKLLKFEADWCGPCREMGRRLEKFNDCEVVKINVDDEENQDIVSKYGIRNIPVIILLDDDENIVKKWVGLTKIEDIQAEIAKKIS